MIRKRILSTISSVFAKTEPDNTKRHRWLPHTYTIRGEDGTAYLTRTLFPRLRGKRVLLHRIHRADQALDCHNHPWRTATFYILSGGYTERRAYDEGSRQIDRTFRPGDVNRLTHASFHNLIEVLPDTWTLGILGERLQDWGFLVDGVVVPHAEYLKRPRGMIR